MVRVATIEVGDAEIVERAAAGEDGVDDAEDRVLGSAENDMTYALGYAQAEVPSLLRRLIERVASGVGSTLLLRLRPM